jgi:hypothetical protein
MNAIYFWISIEEWLTYDRIINCVNKNKFIYQTMNLKSHIYYQLQSHIYIYLFLLFNFYSKTLTIQVLGARHIGHLDPTDLNWETQLLHKHLWPQGTMRWVRGTSIHMTQSDCRCNRVILESVFIWLKVFLKIQYFSGINNAPRPRPWS